MHGGSNLLNKCRLITVYEINIVRNNGGQPNKNHARERKSSRPSLQPTMYAAFVTMPHSYHALLEVKSNFFEFFPSMQPPSSPNISLYSPTFSVI